MTYYQILLVFCILCAMVSCKKYEDGPLISLRSAQKRIKGTYNIEKFEVNGIDSTLALKLKYCNDFVSFGFNRERAEGTLGATICAEIGEWTLFSDDEKIRIEFRGTLSSIGPWGGSNIADWEILRLKNEEMVFKTNYNGIEYKVSLEEKR